MSRANLAKASQVSKAEIKRLEASGSVPRPKICTALENALEAAGVEFIEGGVRLRR
jgi:ribosome-binding protein aMBF1 (putative translation factor)